MKNLSPEELYQASYEKNPDYEGVFWMGVKTTGIFCRPTCTARKPKFENVEFFFYTKDAILKGYRPCKVCKPLQNLDAIPKEIAQLLEELSQNPMLKLKDWDLKQRGLEPAAVRRWFLKHHGNTFHAFQRMVKLNTAFKKIHQGEPVLEAALDSGYESLSGFNNSFKNIFGVSPKRSKEEKILQLKRIETPLGSMMACADEKGICLLEFCEKKTLPTELKQISQHFKTTILQGENPHFELLEKELDAYFNGQLKTFTVPLSPVGTAFQQSVWEVLRQIPYGETWSYAKQAAALGDVNKVRAVANANGANKISIIIPCHRIIGSDGTLTGYGGGVWRKQKLLDIEKSV